MHMRKYLVRQGFHYPYRWIDEFPLSIFTVELEWGNIAAVNKYHISLVHLPTPRPSGRVRKETISHQGAMTIDAILLPRK